MITETLNTETESLENIQNGVTTPCVSIIIPTHKTSPDRVLDKPEVTKMIDKAKTILLSKYGNSESNKIIHSLDNLAETIDYTHNDMGIGFFVSPRYSELVSFPFTVQEKIVIGDSFEIRDLIYLSNYLTGYYLLTINLNEVKIFKGNGKILKEVKDENFPSQFLDDYEYERPNLGTSFGYTMKSVEKDKSVMKEIRLSAFLKEVDKKLSKYLTNGTPLIISGVKKELGYFQKITSHNKNLIGKIVGNYYQNHNGLLGQLAQKEMEAYHIKAQEEALNKLEEAVGKKLVAFGVEEVWRAAQEGKGLLLLIEKDYSLPGYVSEDNYHLYIKRPLKKHKIASDCIDDIMELVKEKNGKIMFVENGKLDKFEKIALMLRY